MTIIFYLYKTLTINYLGIFMLIQPVNNAAWGSNYIYRNALFILFSY
jgi:hypothetical protein